MEQKFRKLLDEHSDRVYGLAAFLLGNPAQAQDVTQETFEKLWKNIADIRVEQAIGWLLRVTRNACLDTLRRRSRSLAVEHFECPDYNCPETTLQAQQLRRQLGHAVAELDEPYRSLVVLRDMQQHSYQEVAQILELSMSQVKVYLHRARQRLRKRVEAMEL